MDDEEALTNVVALVRKHGVDLAREMADSREARRHIEIASRVLADEQQAVGISYSGMCLTGLPYRRLPDDQHWIKRGHRVTLLIEPGILLIRGKPVRYGVPWGSRGRILLMHITTQAVRTRSREVVLGRSARDALERMGLACGGESVKAIRDQAHRLAACHLRFAWEYGGGDVNTSGAILSDSFTFRDEDERQASLFQDRVVLDERFFAALLEHPVPFSEEAVRQLSYSPMALDAYTWLGYRLHALERPADVSWAALAAQFGPDYKAIRQFRADFLKALSAACAAYPDAKVNLTDRGVRLTPSPPPVPKIAATPSG